jgi:chemotaxis protein MotB
MNMAIPARPLVIVRHKKRGHENAAHKGAWKVAYADFVTAMMSLFMVLWLLASGEPVKKAVSSYFTDPKGHGRDVGNGMHNNGTGSISLNKDEMSRLKDRLQRAVRQEPALEKLKDHVVITVTAEGLGVELIEGEGSLFFESGNAEPTEVAGELLGKMAHEVSKLPNKITIEGHTDSRSFVGRVDYSNWELSADRANAARRLMQKFGVRRDQVSQVRGYADQNPRNRANPSDPSNRRVTLIIQYQDPVSAPGLTPNPQSRHRPNAAGL